MRYAVVLALWDPHQPDLAAWSDAIAALSTTLAGRGFGVAVVDGNEDVQAATARALGRLTPRDTLLLHVSGHLARRGVLRLPGGDWLPFRSLGDALAERGISQVSVLAELLHDDDPTDPQVANEHVDAVVAALQARERGYAVVATARPASAPVEGLGFTNLLLRVAREPHRGDVTLTNAFGRAAGTPERLAVAPAIAFERGAFELSLAPLPSPDELDELIAASTDARDWRRVVELRRMRLEAHDTPRARVRELVSIARILQAELDEPEQAIDALEEARAIDPARVPVLQALRRGYERLGRWASAIESVGALADLADAPSDRAELQFARARLVLERLGDEERAVELFEQTLADDPTHERARAALAELLWRRAAVAESRSAADDDAELLEEAEELEEIEDAEEIEEAGPPGNVEAVATDAEERTHVEREEATHVLGASAAPDDEPPPTRRGDYSQLDEVALGAADGPSRSSLPTLPPAGSLFERLGADMGPLAEAPAEAAAPSDPPSAPPDAPTGVVFDALTHEEAFAAHRREGRTDRAFLAALALEELGAADVDQQVLIDQFRSVAPIRARGTLDVTAWALLEALGTDVSVDAVFRAVARAAVAARREELAAADQLVEPDPSTQVDEKSTALVARTFHWAARVLGVSCPALFLVDQAPREIAAMRGRKPSTALAPSVVQGRSPKELAFLAARHLTYYRPEFELAIYYPTREDLIRLLFAALQVVRPRTTPPAGTRAVASLRNILARKLTERDRAALAEAVRLLESRGGKASVGSWTRALELTATRAGLFLSGDLSTAMSLLRAEFRTTAAFWLEEKRRDLIAFCASDAHAELRSRYAVTAPESVQPPPFLPHNARQGAAAAASE